MNPSRIPWIALFFLLSLVNGSAAAAEPSKATPEPIDRIKLGGLASLIKIQEIRDELNLTQKQSDAILGAIADYDTEDEKEKAERFNFNRHQESFVDSFNKRMENTQRRMAAFDKTVLDQLSNDQQRRLRQLKLQAWGARAFLDRVIIRALELTIEQEDQLERMNPSFRPVSSDPVEIQQEVEKELEAATKILTAEQKAKWEKIIGKRLITPAMMKATSRYIEPIQEHPRPVPIPVVPGKP